MKQTGTDRGRTSVHVTGIVIAETEKAYKFEHNDMEPTWLPKSQCEWNEQDDAMIMPRWLADNRGFNY